MDNLIKVERVFFDPKREQPVLMLEDGTSRVVHLIPTGNCWVEYWVTPEQRKKAEDETKARDKQLQEAASMHHLEEQAKKRWWQR